MAKSKSRARAPRARITGGAPVAEAQNFWSGASNYDPLHGIEIGGNYSAAVSPSSFDTKYLATTFDAAPSTTVGAWDVRRITEARQAHKLGLFTTSGYLASQFLTDPRIYAGLLQRIGPPFALAKQVQGSQWWNGKGLAEDVRLEAESMFHDGSRAVPPAVLGTIFATDAIMGCCIAQNVVKPRPDGSRWDFELRPWPMRHSWWNQSKRCYQVQTTTDGVVDVRHGDGKWVVFEPWGFESFDWGALPALSICYGDRRFAIRDRSNHAQAHGSPAIVGTLPQGIKPQSTEAAAFEARLRMLQNSRSGLIKPFGTTIEYLEAKTLAYQIFGDILTSNNQDIAIALLGQDGTTENKGGTYTKALVLDGVRYDLVKIDIRGVEEPINSGFLRPWTILNHGEEKLASVLSWLVPDPREDARRAELAARVNAFNAAIAGFRANGFACDQAFCERLAKSSYGLNEIPKLVDPSGKPAAPPPPNAKQDPGTATATKQEDFEGEGPK